MTDVTFSGCAGTATSPTVTPANLPWSFNAVSYNAGTGVTSGTVTGFTVTVSTGYCTFTIGAPGGGPGMISATYTNSNPNTAVDLIDLSSTDLEVQTTSGSGCASLYVPGHDITLLGQYGVVPPGQTITSP
ncbi:hypothetical protein [Actinomadura livida]|uniref:Uncharacterized protein n=1 Tax=Actinomadura livida TaxID=79909 RepID=A0A7W7II46_9ACTN|nr:MULTISPECIES: hypothetical protein [Actinomadura]MBB4777523.1 hypothetical protein [Actinomadura catellatispora]